MFADSVGAFSLMTIKTLCTQISHLCAGCTARGISRGWERAWVGKGELTNLSRSREVLPATFLIKANAGAVKACRLRAVDSASCACNAREHETKASGSGASAASGAHR